MKLNFSNSKKSIFHQKKSTKISFYLNCFFNNPKTTKIKTFLLISTLKPKKVSFASLAQHSNDSCSLVIVSFFFISEMKSEKRNFFCARPQNKKWVSEREEISLLPQIFACRVSKICGEKKAIVVDAGDCRVSEREKETQKPEV